MISIDIQSSKDVDDDDGCFVLNLNRNTPNFTMAS